jgi:hypothetical protein
MRTLIASTALLAVLSIPAYAYADKPDYSVAAHVGVLVPQLSTELDSSALLGLELGYVVPLDMGGLERPLGFQFDVMGTAPGASGGGTSEQLGEGGTYEYDIRVSMVILELTASWRFALGELGGVYLQAGPRAYFLETTVDASSGGAKFGRRTQGDNALGGVVALGGDLILGPGAVFLAAEYAGSDLKTRLAGDANTGALAFDLGYRLRF